MYACMNTLYWLACKYQCISYRREMLCCVYTCDQRYSMLLFFLTHFTDDLKVTRDVDFWKIVKSIAES